MSGIEGAFSRSRTRFETLEMGEKKKKKLHWPATMPVMLVLLSLLTALTVECHLEIVIVLTTEQFSNFEMLRT